jgi:predicted membrane protein
MRASTTNRGALLTGLALMGIGVFWFLRKMGVVFPEWLTSWPMILVLVGVGIGIQHKFSNPASYILVALGVLFLLEPAFSLPKRLYEFFWPAVFIGLGVVVLANYFRSSNKKSQTDSWMDPEQLKKKISESDTTGYGQVLIKEVCIFGENNKTIQSENFAGGEVSTIFGSSSIILGDAKLTNPAYLNATVLFGDTKIYVPADWVVENRVQSVLGAAKDKRIEPSGGFNPSKKLVISGTAIFGELSIKSMRYA